MTRVRIYTENKRLKGIEYLVQKHWDCFSVYKIDGIWHGKPEKSVVIEVILDDYPTLNRHVDTLCKQICALNEQANCMVVIENVQADFRG